MREGEGVYHPKYLKHAFRFVQRDPQCSRIVLIIYPRAMTFVWLAWLHDFFLSIVRKQPPEQEPFLFQLALQGGTQLQGWETAGCRECKNVSEITSWSRSKIVENKFQSV